MEHSGCKESKFVNALQAAVYEETEFFSEHEERVFTDSEILVILDILDNICTDCYDGDNTCQCSNDE